MTTAWILFYICLYTKAVVKYDFFNIYIYVYIFNGEGPMKAKVSGAQGSLKATLNL